MDPQFQIFIDRLKGGHTHKLKADVDTSFLEVTAL